MANSWPSPDSKLSTRFAVDQPRPMLKDFLANDPTSDFRSFPPKFPNKLLRSKSKAALTTISAIHKASEMFVNAVKHLPFAAVKAPSILPRSISRRLSKRSRREYNDILPEVSITVKVKDILRWRSFRDVVMEEGERSPPLDDFSSSPHRCTTITTTTGSSTATHSGSSSWCESDFTSEDLPLWCGNSDGEKNARGKESLPGDGVGRDYVEPTTRVSVICKGEMSCEEVDHEQQSPISVLEVLLNHHDVESFSSSHQSLVDIKSRRRMLMQKLQELDAELRNQFPYEDQHVELEEEEEGMAKRLLNDVKATTTLVESCKTSTMDRLLFDFFKHELSTSINPQDHNEEFENEIMRVAKAWIKGESNKSSECELVNKREICVREMDGELRWNNFGEEQENMVFEIQNAVLSHLVDELLDDLINHC